MKAGNLVAILFLIAGVLFMGAGALPALFGGRPFNVAFFTIGCATAVLGIVFMAVSKTGSPSAKR
jgi:hypothetical protein